MSILPLRRVATATFALLLLAPVTALAATAGDHGEHTPLNLPTSDPKPLSTSGGSGSLVRTFVGLAIVIAVIYGVTWVLKQVKSSREERTRGTGLSTAAVVALGPGRSLHLIRAGRELVLVGVADHGVVPIRTYSEEEAVRLGLDAPDEPDAPAGSGLGAGAGPRPGRRLTTVSSLIDALRDRTAR
jgi:flagellar protein FliO/FliZ